jgi:hypothetical protein
MQCAEHWNGFYKSAVTGFTFCLFGCSETELFGPRNEIHRAATDL